MDDKILIFWNTIAPLLNVKGLIYDISFIEKMDNLLKGFGNLSWEIGPDENREMYLAISPSLEPDLHSLTKQFVKLSPNMENWNFYDCKQKKALTSVRITTEEYGGEIIDAKDLKFRILKDENYTPLFLDIYKNRDLMNINRANSIEMLLTNLIGEFNLMYFIEGFDLKDLENCKDKEKLWNYNKLISYLEKYAKENSIE
jgi:hypothetical protein